MHSRCIPQSPWMFVGADACWTRISFHKCAPHGPCRISAALLPWQKQVSSIIQQYVLVQCLGSLEKARGAI